MACESPFTLSNRCFPHPFFVTLFYYLDSMKHLLSLFSVFLFSLITKQNRQISFFFLVSPMSQEYWSYSRLLIFVEWEIAGPTRNGNLVSQKAISIARASDLQKGIHNISTCLSLLGHETDSKHQTPKHPCSLAQPFHLPKGKRNLTGKHKPFGERLLALSIWLSVEVAFFPTHYAKASWRRC